MKTYQTIRQFAKENDRGLTEGTLRRMVRCGECPGFYSGTRFMVNTDALIDLLEKRSAEAVKAGGANYAG